MRNNASGRIRSKYDKIIIIFAAPISPWHTESLRTKDYHNFIVLLRVPASLRCALYLSFKFIVASIPRDRQPAILFITLHFK